MTELILFFLFGILVILLWFAPLMAMGLWIVWPIERIARQRNKPVRYSIADFLCLFVAIQVPLGIITWYSSNLVYVDDEILSYLRYVSATLAVLGLLIWWGAVRAISFCGIYHGWRRMLFLGVIVPIVFYGLVPFSLLLLACLAAILDSNNLRLFAEHRWVLASTVFLGCALYVCGIVIRKVILPGSAATPEQNM